MLIPKNSGGRIRLARNMLGFTRKKFEDVFKISVNTLQSWENGKNPLTQKGAKKLNQAFIQKGLLCSEEWLLDGEGVAPMLMNEAIEFPSEILEDICILREIETFKAVNPDPIVIIISDNGMEPIYKIGDYVAGNKKINEEILSIIGENCIVETLQGDTFVRKILPGSKESIYNLVCLNIYTNLPPIIPDIKIRYAAKIVFHRKKESSKE